ncbi:MAG: GTPase domain-containing protein [Endozoicomonadaceae bacterium]|nr:GTPase domain-containing protein [Endozoicomonadaceae bacterium]
MNPFEVASYSWNLNASKPVLSRIFQTIGATISSAFRGHTIDVVDVHNLIKKNPAYTQCYFYKSLTNRGIKTNLTTATATLVRPEGYENHKLVAIDGRQHSGKSGFINELRNKNDDDDDAAFVHDGFGTRPPCSSSASLYKLNEEVALCELPKYTIVGSEIDEPHRYDDYDFVVIMTQGLSITDADTSLMKTAQNAGKPYIVVMTYTQHQLDSPSRHQKDKTAHDEIIDKNYHSRAEDHLKELDLTPSNGKVLIINNDKHNDFDFQEVSKLIASQNFNGTNA